ncbi:MAG: ATP-binding cassette domain-containing protein [Albidovulum sp.]|nr:ATP-binding cassette domain-containing protein [Albidovulum sp.]
MLGSNGAGKTSTISSLAGIVRCKGSIMFMGRKISTMAVEDRVRAGISVAPEGRRVFGNLTVEENLFPGTGVRNDSAGARKDVKF